jgi:RNA polymerase sigma-70 factor (ECF subfamily)
METPRAALASRAPRAAAAPRAAGTGRAGTAGTALTAERWLAANWPLLLSAVRSVLNGPGTAEDVEDAAQDAAVSIWRYWDTPAYDETRGSRETWAFTIARRRAIDYRRRQSRRRAATLPPGPGATFEDAEPLVDPMDVEHTVADRAEIRALWPSLTSRERAATALLADGYTYREAAVRLAWPLGTLKSRLRALRGRVATLPAAEMAAAG